MVVVVQPLWQSCAAVGVSGIRPDIRPLLEQDPVEALDLAIRLRPVGARAFVHRAAGSHGGGEDPVAVAGAVVGEDSRDRKADAGEVGTGPVPKRRGSRPLFI